MELARTEEERAFQATLRRFCEADVAPHAIAVDRGEHSIWEAYRGLGRHGLLAPAFPEEYGGGGGGWAMLAIHMAELARACASTALSTGASILLGGGTVLRFGTEEQKRRYLPRLASGESIASLALTEPGAGSDVMSIATRAERDGDGWVLRGQKTFISNAPVADLFVVYAATGERDGKKTLGTFLVEGGAPGLSAGPPMAKMGMRGSPTSEVFLEDVRVPPENVLGDPERGFAQAMAPLTGERALAPALALGVLERCLERCVAYAVERVQFGRPIASFQAIQFKLARMAADVETLKAVLHSVIDGLEAGRDVRRLVSAGKVLAGEASVRGTLEAIQVLGGYGYVEEFEVERALRDVKLLEIGAGTTEVQLLVIARELLGELAR